MMTTRFLRATIALIAGVSAACARTPATAPVPVPEPVPAPAPPPAPVVSRYPSERAPLPPVNPALPEVPHVTGPLAIKVIYPAANAVIQSKDSNFIFGNIGNGDAALTINGVPTPVWPNGSFMGWLKNPTPDNPSYELLAKTESDSASLVLPVKLPPPPPANPAPPDTIVRIEPPRWAKLIGPPAYASDTERVVTGYARTGGIQRWFLLPNTMVQVVGKRGNDSYIRLDSSQIIRIESKDVQLIDSTRVDSTFAPPKALVASRFTITKKPEYTDIVIPLTVQPLHYVDESGSVITLTIYNAKGPARKQRPVRVTGASYVDSVHAIDNGTAMQYSIKLRGPVFGYQSLWEKGKFIFRVRKPPVIDPANPLKGLTITIDPGHPPIGATGPTGLWEPEVTLPVGLKARELLQAKGVNVVMTRTTPDPVDLNLRETISRRANAHAFVSFHLNALPDGLNPFLDRGTAVYHYYMHSEPLAAAVLAGAVPQLGLPNNGVKRENFAVIRGTWMPSILVEGAFIILPDQEAALRTPEYQARYAQGIVDGLEAYFRSLASRQK